MFNLNSLLMAFDIGFKCCEAGKDFSKSKLSFLETVKKGLKQVKTE